MYNLASPSSNRQGSLEKISTTSNEGRPRLPGASQLPHVVREVMADWYAIPIGERERVAHLHHTSAAIVGLGLLSLARHLHRAWGDCFVAQKTLRTLYGSSERTWNRIVHTLVELQLLECLRGQAAWDVYGEVMPDIDLNCSAYRFTAWCKRHELQRRPRSRVPRPVKRTWAKRVLRQAKHSAERTRRAQWEIAVRDAQRAAREAGHELQLATHDLVSLRARRGPREGGMVPLGSTLASAARVNASAPPLGKSQDRVSQLDDPGAEKHPAKQGISVPPTGPAALVSAADWRQNAIRTFAGAVPRGFPPKPRG